MKLSAALAAVVLFFFGCTQGPDYRRPQVEAPDRWRFETAEARKEINAAWWTEFGDPTLTSLVEEAVGGNPDLAEATARVEEYLGLLGVARADFFPQVNARAKAGQSRITERGQTPVPGTVPNPAAAYNAGLSASFELDVWGRIQRENEAARAELLGAEWARRTVLLTLAASVASAYVALLDLDEQLAVARRTVETRKNSLALFEIWHEGGIISDLELWQARSLYEEAHATIPGLELAIAREENALSVLLGRNPGAVSRGKDLAGLVYPVVPDMLPSRVLEDRPDIQKAESELIAANARIGVARARYFPSISLTGAFGFASKELTNLFTQPATAWAWAGEAAGPVFTAGATAGNVRAAEARQQEALARYRKTILTAFREVEDALAGIGKMREKLSIQSSQVKSLQEYAEAARLRYENGYTSYLDVLDAERGLFNAELDRVRTRNDLFQSLVTLYKALGGGWEVMPGNRQEAPHP
ncbi:MAG: efflux transporter outer membrane subunit [Thermodesulfobacteriota bacterium]